MPVSHPPLGVAAAFFKALADPARARALSAGTAPGERVHAEVVELMREVGIDLAGARPQRLTDELASAAQVLITIGCGEACPVVPGLVMPVPVVGDIAGALVIPCNTSANRARRA